MSTVRVRFAPSPTGPLHIGGLRTALYNYLFARKSGGTMLLRIEDTDQTRFVPGAEEYIKEALAWVGIQIDEGPDNPGEAKIYRQSERKPMYRQYAEELVAKGFAYYAFDTEEDLDAMRERLKAAKVVSPQYNAITRNSMTNSVTLPEDEVKARLRSGVPYVIRLKVPRKEEVRLNDMIRDWVRWHSSELDDKVLLKSDGMPTYHLANVVDDHLMKITHVIRGEEWLPSAPIHVLLYRYLGWEETMPKMAHLPLLLKPDGNGKLSKRDGIAGGFPVFPMEWKDPASGDMARGFREDGYLPDALVNFLAFLGWNPGTNQEIFSMEELIEAFTIERIGKAGTKFDIQKAQWFNQQYLRQKSNAELLTILNRDLKAHGFETLNEDKGSQVIDLLKERAVFVQDLFEHGRFLFELPKIYDEKIVESKWNAESRLFVETFTKAIEAESSLEKAEDFKHVFHATLEQLALKPGKVMQSLRLSLTGMGAGPDLLEIMAILGKEQTANRLSQALQTLPKA
jgi:glutamyl-tRNA synthetase